MENLKGEKEKEQKTKKLRCKEEERRGKARTCA